MPKWTVFLTSWKVSNSQSKEFVLITEIFWQIFWRDNWRSLIVVVENFRSKVNKYWWIKLKMYSSNWTNFKFEANVAGISSMGWFANVANSRNSEYYVILILMFFFNVQNWDRQQSRDSCLKINKYYIIFEIS